MYVLAEDTFQDDRYKKLYSKPFESKSGESENKQYIYKLTKHYARLCHFRKVVQVSSSDTEAENLHCEDPTHILYKYKAKDQYCCGREGLDIQKKSYRL